jgi:hypothetical protein
MPERKIPSRLLSLPFLPAILLAGVKSPLAPLFERGELSLDHFRTGGGGSILIKC